MNGASFCFMDSANLSRYDYQPHTLKVLLLTGGLLFYDGRIRRVQTSDCGHVLHPFVKLFAPTRGKCWIKCVRLLLCLLHDYTSAVIPLTYEEWILQKP